MAFHIKQHNYEKVPTAEQRKVFTEAFGMVAGAIPVTRIAAHLEIRRLLASDPRYKTMLKTWQAARMVKRAAKAAALAAIGQAPAR